jgi:coenzyme F420-reducing hydrogenase alpha subunit
MHSGNITIENITKIEGAAGLDVVIENGKVVDVKFKIKDSRRFFTDAVKNKPFISAPSFLSRICGTCSVAHLFATIKAIENSQEIDISDQTKTLRGLAYDALIIRDHALHLYFFVLPDLLGLDSILDIPDDHDDLGHILLHDSFDIKQLGTDISDTIIGAAIHAPFPTIGGFLKLPDPSKFPQLLERLEKIRPQVLRGIKAFFDYKASLEQNVDYVALRNKNQFDFLEGTLVTLDGKKILSEKFLDHFESVVIPYSQSEGYVFSDTHENYVLGALARINLNKDQLNPRTIDDTKEFLSVFPSRNIYHNNLAQAIEILHCVDDSIEILNNIKIVDEKPVKKPLKAGVGIGVVEAPRGTLYHKAKVDEKGIVVDYDVIVPTSQNQISIEKDLKKYFNENLDKGEDKLKLDAESIIRAYDPCMSCATNFLKIDWIRK